MLMGSPTTSGGPSATGPAAAVRRVLALGATDSATAWPNGASFQGRSANGNRIVGPPGTITTRAFGPTTPWNGSSSSCASVAAWSPYSPAVAQASTTWLVSGSTR